MKYIITFTFSSILLLKTAMQSVDDIKPDLSGDQLTITFTNNESLYNQDINTTFHKLQKKFKWSLISYLELRNVSKGEIFKGASFEAFPQLIGLMIKNSRINYLPESTFEGLHELCYLELVHIQLKSMPANLLKFSPILYWIRLDDNELEDLPTGLFFNLSKVQEIHLHSNKLKTLPKEIFHPSLQDLTRLLLMDNRLIRLEEDVFLSTKLQYLNLSLNTVSHVDKYAFKELRNLTEIIMTGTFTAEMGSLPKEIFANLKKLKKIKMNQNHFQSLEVGIFHDLPELGSLDLSFNQLTKLDDDIFKNNIQLKWLCLSNNKLSHIGKNVFTNLSDVSELYLQNNQLSKLDPSIFSKLSAKLSIFNISNNQVDLAADTNFSVLKNCGEGIRKLYAKNNNISRIFRDWRQNRWLRTLDLRFNPIPPSEINCDYRWRIIELDLTTNEYMEYPINVNKSLISNLDAFCRESNHNTNRTHILDSYSNCNRSIFGCSCMIFMDYKLKRTFLNCTRFDETKLVKKLPDPVIKRNFETECIFSNCNLTSILPVSKYLQQLNNVTKLVLSENKLTSLNDLPELPALKVLELHKNMFTTLDQNATKMLNRSKHLATITLHQNPWNCICDQEYFWNFINSHESMIYRMDELRCNNGKPVEFYNAGEPCDPSSYELAYSTWYILILAIPCIICAVLTYKYKLQLEIWMYNNRFFSLWSPAPNIDKTKEYDAFVCFTQHEDEFIRNKLMPQLERSNPSFKLCIHTRDWLGGDHIPTQIHRSVVKSQCTIIVLSNNFLKSVHCKEELQTAHNQSLIDKSHRIFIIGIEKIAINELDEELKSCIDECLHIPWRDNKWFWKKLRYFLSHGFEE